MAYDTSRLSPLEKQCLEIIEEELECKYTGGLKVEIVHSFYSKEPVGYSLILYLNNPDKPMYITCEGSLDDFLRVVRSQIREDNIPSHVTYNYAQIEHTVKDC